MDQIKIGRFIAECRKKAGMTQMQLAEKLGVTDRAVSKWETGKSLPDAAIMLDLCAMLHITVNDLLTGEVVSMEDQNKMMEKNLIDAVAAKEAADKRMLTFEWVIAGLSTIIILVPAIISRFLPIEEWQQVLIAFSGFIPALVGFGFALRIEQIAGYYECEHCKHKHVPKFGATLIAPHIGRTRHMRCPSCGKKSWQKKVISKD
ncbi:MAG: helix-turn-helix domain-containing protein [Clostridia bacterium]|nr:helix-turn-helix domain-containing protein [Clostridia bacterium]